MQAKTGCPNCGHQNYLPFKVNNSAGDILLEPLNLAGLPAIGGKSQNEAITERINAFFIKGVKASEYDLVFDGPRIVITPKITVTCTPGDQPANCPDCQRLLPMRSEPIRSVEPMGLTQLILQCEGKDDMPYMRRMFQEGVPWTIDVRRKGNGVVIRAIVPERPAAPAPTGKPETLAEFRERAVMDGITGAEKMSREQIEAERAKMAKV